MTQMATCYLLLINIKLKAENIYLVYDFGGDVLKATIDKDSTATDLTFVEQKEQLGSGHAVDQASPFIKYDEDVDYAEVAAELVRAMAKLRVIRAAKKKI